MNREVDGQIPSETRERKLYLGPSRWSFFSISYISNLCVLVHFIKFIKSLSNLRGRHHVLETCFGVSKNQLDEYCVGLRDDKFKLFWVSAVSDMVL